MNRKLHNLARYIVILVALTGPPNVTPNSHWYGEADDRSFAIELWDVLQEARLAGDNALPQTPYVGTHPHGAILESVIATVSINNVETTVVVKRSYRGKNVTVESVAGNRNLFLDDITVMLKREQGYDPENQDWFWAKYNKDGSLAATPNGIKLAGRIAKGKRKGCIACHRKAPGDDYLFIN